MTNPLFTVIVPMYNVAQYIERCLKSIFKQELIGASYEIILINDGSPDDSQQVATEYCKGKDNVKIIAQQNKGLGGARNTGMQNASGQFIIFLDSDDWLENHAFVNLQKFLSSNHDLDVIEFPAGIFKNGEEISRINFNNSNVTDGLTYYFANKSINSACNKLYRRSFLQKNGIIFLEKIYGEDFAFNTWVYLYAKKFQSINVKIINFDQSADSITRNNDLQKKIKYLNDNKFIIRSILQFIETNSLHQPQMLFLKERITQKNATILTIFLKNKFSFTFFIDFMNELKQQNLYYIKSKVNVPKYNYVRLFYKNWESLFKLVIRLKATL